MHLLSWKVLGGLLKISLEQNSTNISDYAILSHRWGDPKDEVSFEDMLHGRQESKKGYAKLVGCCNQARKDGLRYVWIDTCCINKASSAELSEAITSMFRYYEQSKVCYVFLDDLLIDSKENLRSSSFSRSAWFTRGWTLQELIAPSQVKFFDQLWLFLGYKTDESLCPVIESVTGIDSVVLNIPATTKLISISKKMSWAARRNTTRIEDMAYSLMGIFGVYMSPLYGEGHYAFIRLQEAIMKTSNDHTIFAWTSPPTARLIRGFEHVSTMLALSPDQFDKSSNFKPLSYSNHNKVFTSGGHRLDYAITNAGLAIRLPLQKIDQVEGLYAAFLACTDGEEQVPSAIFLSTTTETPAGHFWRTNWTEGPIERSERRWFPTSGRNAVDANDIYILPRFSSVSGDNIEPPWSRANISKTQVENVEDVSSKANEGRFGINTEVLNNLDHVLDPSFRELAFLRQTHQMITTNQVDQLLSMTKTGLRLPKTLPRSRNTNFYGRAAALQKLRDVFFLPGKHLRGQDRRTTSCVISGMGGVGKTRVALEFSYDGIENRLFDAVIWISAVTPMSIHDGFRRIASELKLAEKESPIETTVNEVLRWLSDFDQHAKILSGSSALSAKWLLVFDDVEDVSYLDNVWPSSGPGCVLATSRNSNLWFTLGSESIVLEPFTLQESSELLSNLTRKNWDFTVVSERLGGLPLAIAQWAEDIVRLGLSLEKVVRFLDGKKFTAVAKRHSIHERSLGALWSSIFNRLSPSSHGILQVISFLNPHFIPSSIFVSPRPVALEELPRKESELLESLSELLQGSLVRTLDRDGLQTHRLVQSAVRERMQTYEYRRALSSAVALVSSAWINANSLEHGSLPNTQIRADLLPHALRLKDFANEITDLEDDFGTNTTFTKLWSDVEDAQKRLVRHQAP